MKLKRAAPTPLYIQLKNTLTAQITQGDYVAHQQLPSERELCEHFNVSRTTVRQAIADLMHEELVYSRAGKGTFVSELKISQQLRALTGFSQDVHARDSVPSSRILQASIFPTTPHLAETLQIAPSTEVLLLSRLRLADGIPLAIENTYLRHNLCPHILKHDFAHESLYKVLASEYALRLVRSEQTIEAGLAEAEELSLLQMQPPAAVLKMERLTYTDQNVLVEYTRSSYRGDRYKFRATLLAQNIGAQ